MRTVLFALLLYVPTCFGVDELSSEMQSVVIALEKAGIVLGNIKIQEHDQDTNLPNTYDEKISFSLESVAPSGGQLFVFSKKKYADVVYSYFDMYRQLAPYVYMSKDGLVLAQLNSGLSVKEAENFEEVLNNFNLNVDE